MMTRNNTLRCLAWITGILLLTTGVARAQDVDPRVAPIAQKLYEDGVALMRAKKFSKACPKLEQVTKLVPNGIGGHEALGDCYVGLGRLASAWGQYVQLEALAKTAGRQQTRIKASTEAKRLKPKLAMVTITVPDRMRSVAGLSVTYDGLVQGHKSWGTPIPADAGTHDIEATAPGYTAQKRTVTLAEGQAVTVELSPRKNVTSPRRVGAYVVGSVGIAGLVLGGVMGGLAIRSKGVIDDHCGPATSELRYCDDDGRQAGADGDTQGLASTIGFTLGATGIVSAVILLVTEPKPLPVAPGRFQAGMVSFGRDGAVFGMRGAW